MAVMRLILGSALPAPWQMALDEAMALSVRAGRAPPTLRLYTWEKPAFTVGHLQRIEETFDLEACLQAGIPVVRRLTGGRAVYHDREVTYAIAAGADHPLFRGGVRQTFRTIGQALIAGLEVMGLKGVLSEPGSRHLLGNPVDARSPLCFLVNTGYDVIVRGKKLIGSAQRRWPDGFLQQGSLPLTLTPRAFLPYLRPALSLHEVMSACTSLAEVLGREVGSEEAGRRLRQGFESGLGVQFVVGAPTQEEWEAAEGLARQRYASLPSLARPKGSV